MYKLKSVLFKLLEQSSEIFVYLFIVFISPLISAALSFVVTYLSSTSDFTQPPDKLFSFINFVLTGLFATSQSLASFLSATYLTYKKKSVGKGILIWFALTFSSGVLDIIIRWLLFPAGLLGGLIQMVMFMMVYYFHLLVLPHALLGVVVGKLLCINQKKDIRITSFLFTLSWKTVAIMVNLGLFLTLISGIFWSEIRKEEHNDRYWYYIHRGVPIVYSGVSAADRDTPFPIIKVSIFTKAYADDKTHPYTKIIDLPYFFLALLLYSVAAYIPSTILAHIEVNKKRVLLLALAWCIVLGYTLFLWGQGF